MDHLAFFSLLLGLVLVFFWLELLLYLLFLNLEQFFWELLQVLGPVFGKVLDSEEQLLTTVQVLLLSVLLLSEHPELQSQSSVLGNWKAVLLLSLKI